MIEINIKEIRRRKKMTQKRLASETSITREYLSAVENSRKVPSLVLLNKLASALGVSITDLLSDQPGAVNVLTTHSKTRRKRS